MSTYGQFTSAACGRIAGVSVGDGVRREHRRVEHRGRDGLVLRMRRFGRALVAALRCLYVSVYVCHMYPQSAYFPSAWTVWVRLARVLASVGVQREHRRVGHGARDKLWPVFAPFRGGLWYRWGSNVRSRV